MSPSGKPSEPMDRRRRQQHGAAAVGAADGGAAAHGAAADGRADAEVARADDEARAAERPLDEQGQEPPATATECVSSLSQEQLQGMQVVGQEIVPASQALVF